MAARQAAQNHKRQLALLADLVNSEFPLSFLSSITFELYLKFASTHLPRHTTTSRTIRRTSNTMDRIITCPDREAHAVLVALCHSDVNFLSRADDLLSQLRMRELLNGNKRKADDDQPLVCEQCDDVYSEEDNTTSSCHYHEGDLEPDPDADIWAEYDEEKYGPMDSEANRDEYPSGFFWNCCGKHADEDEPCMTGKHVAPVGQKRGRYDDNQDSGSDQGEDNGDDDDDDESDEYESDGFEDDAAGVQNGANGTRHMEHVEEESYDEEDSYDEDEKDEK